MKNNIKLPAVLAISLLLVFTETAGAFFSGSFALFTHAGTVILTSLFLMPSISTLYGTKSYDLSGIQVLAAVLNAAALCFIAVFIIFKAVSAFYAPRHINTILACLMVFAGGAGMFVCAVLLRENYKNLSRIYFLPAGLSIFVIIGLMVSRIADIYFLDPLLSIILAAVIIIQAAVLIIKSVSVMKNKVLKI